MCAVPPSMSEPDIVRSLDTVSHQEDGAGNNIILMKSKRGVRSSAVSSQRHSAADNRFMAGQDSGGTWAGTCTHSTSGTKCSGGPCPLLSQRLCVQKHEAWYECVPHRRRRLTDRQSLNQAIQIASPFSADIYSDNRPRAGHGLDPDTTCSGKNQLQARLHSGCK